MKRKRKLHACHHYFDFFLEELFWYVCCEKLLDVYWEQPRCTISSCVKLEFSDICYLILTKQTKIGEKKNLIMTTSLLEKLIIQLLVYLFIILKSNE